MAQSRRVKKKEEETVNLFLLLRVIDETLKEPQDDDDCMNLLELRERYILAIRKGDTCILKR